MRQDRFTEQAQETLARSQELVRSYKHSQWDVEHILLAMLQQPKGLTGDILKKLGVKVIHLPEDPQIAGAVGAAVIAAERVSQSEPASS